MKHPFCWILIMASILLMSSCSSSKKAYSGDLDASKTNDAATAQLFSQLVESYSGWSDLYLPVQLSLESPKRMSISGRATMVYGKEIYISLRMLGMEVGMVYINNESIYVVDKFHKYYFAEDISTLLKEYKLSLTDLQDLILGRAVLPGKGIITEKDEKEFSFLSSDTQWIMTPRRQMKGADWHYIASRTEPPLLTSVSLRLSQTQAMECRFTEPTHTPAGVVDGICTLTIPYKETDIQVSISWMLNDAKWDSGRQVNFTPPSSSYRRLDMESLLKSMDKM